MIFIHRSITFSKQPLLPESLSDPHLEELSIKAQLGNTKLIISNVYIPSASSCSNGYQSSIEHLLMTPGTLILGDFNVHHPSWYSRSTDIRGRKMADSTNGSDCYSQLGQPHKSSQYGFRCETSALLQLTTDIAVGFNQRKPPDRTVRGCRFISGV